MLPVSGALQLNKCIYEYADIRGEPHAVAAGNINPYLVDGPNVVLTRRSTPICPVPEMVSGNKPIDDGNFLFSPAERAAFVAQEPDSKKWFKRWLGGEEFINQIERWCLSLGECTPAELRSMPHAMRRVQAVKAFREASKSPPTRRLAATPSLFHTTFAPTQPYIAMPQVSSERRNWIPIAFLTPEYLCGDKLRLIANARLVHFGVLNSTMHMSWTRAVCGRLKSDYQYSALVVYNNFPWPDEPTDKQRAAVEVAAQAVLDARAQFPQSSLADLYDPLTMPPVLVKAHQKLDAAVDACYRKAAFASDAQRVEFLFERYQQLTSLLPAEKSAKTRKKKA